MGPLLLRAARGLADAVVVSLATWTLLVHAALVLDWDRDPVTVAWLAVTPVALVALRLIPAADDPPAPAPSRARPAPVTAVLIGLAAVVAVATAVIRPDGSAFTVVWAAVILLAGAGMAAARSGRSAHRPVPDLGPWAVLVVVGVAVVAALVIIRPDLDDVELVNRSLYVEQHDGAFPTRDTVLADEVFAADRPETPATTIEPLVGAVAALVPVSAVTVAHLWLGPLVAGLAVVALHRLLDSLRAPAPALATAAAVGWTLLDGEVLRSVGNFGLARAWQGKVILLVVVVPVLWHHLLRFGRSGDRRSLAVAVVAGVAAVGLSRTGVFVPALIVAAVGVALLVVGQPRRALLAALTVAYPVGAGIVGVLAEGAPVAPRGIIAALQPIVMLPETDPARPWYSVLGNGVGFAVGLLAVLTAWAWVGDRLSAVALATAPAVVALTVSTPGGAGLIDELAGTDAILWRSLWAIPVLAGIGLLLTVAPRWTPHAVRPAAAVVVPLVLFVAFAVDGAWLGSSANRGAEVAWPRWKVDDEDLAAARRLVELTEPGGLVAAPLDVSGVLGTTTLDVRAVGPRQDSLRGRHVVPELRAAERESLTFSLGSGSPDPIATGLARAALTDLPITTVCSRPAVDPADPVIQVLRESGFTEVDRDASCVYWRWRG